MMRGLGVGRQRTDVRKGKQQKRKRIDERIRVISRKVLSTIAATCSNRTFLFQRTYRGQIQHFLGGPKHSITISLADTHTTSTATATSRLLAEPAASGFGQDRTGLRCGLRVRNPPGAPLVGGLPRAACQSVDDVRVIERGLLVDLFDVE
jgi:hypothetical protein